MDIVRSLLNKEDPKALFYCLSIIEKKYKEENRGEEKEDREEDKEEEFSSCENIILSRESSNIMLKQATRNEFYYISQLPLLSSYKLDFPLPPIEGTTSFYVSMNTSIVRGNNNKSLSEGGEKGE